MDIFAAKYESQEEAEAAIPRLIANKRDELRAEADMLDMMITIEPGKTTVCDKCFNSYYSCVCSGGYI
jgi:hypothetical protein